MPFINLFKRYKKSNTNGVAFFVVVNLFLYFISFTSPYPIDYQYFTKTSVANLGTSVANLGLYVAKMGASVAALGVNVAQLGISVANLGKNTWIYE